MLPQAKFVEAACIPSSLEIALCWSCGLCWSCRLMAHCHWLARCWFFNLSSQGSIEMQIWLCKIFSPGFFFFFGNRVTSWNDSSHHITEQKHFNKSIVIHSPFLASSNMLFSFSYRGFLLCGFYFLEADFQRLSKDFPHFPTKFVQRQL